MNSDKLRVREQIGAQMIRGRSVNSGFNPRGKFHVEHWRGGKLLRRQEFANGITDEGKQKIFDLYFLATDTDVPQTAYIGLILSGSTLDATDTYETHGGWIEFTAYTVGGQAKRAIWGTGASTGAGTVTITNASPATFDFTGTFIVNGIFVVTGTTAEIELISNVTAGNALWSTGDLAAPLSVVNADQLKITYTVNA